MKLTVFSNYSLLVKSMRTMNPTTDLTRDGDSLNSLGNLSQLLRVIILTIRFFPLLLNLNLFPATCYSLCPQWKCRAVCHFSICNNLFYTCHKCDHICCSFSSSAFCRLNRSYFLDFWPFLLLFFIYFLTDLFWNRVSKTRHSIPNKNVWGDHKDSTLCLAQNTFLVQSVSCVFGFSVVM